MDRSSIVSLAIEDRFNSNILVDFLSTGSYTKSLTEDECQEEVKKYMDNVVEILIDQCSDEIVLSEWRRENNNRGFTPYSLFEYDQEQHIAFVKAEAFIKGFVIGYMESECISYLSKSRKLLSERVVKIGEQEYEGEEVQKLYEAIKEYENRSRS